jgi:hypothetical protein
VHEHEESKLHEEDGKAAEGVDVAGVLLHDGTGEEEDADEPHALLIPKHDAEEKSTVRRRVAATSAPLGDA